MTEIQLLITLVALADAILLWILIAIMVRR